MAKQIALFNHKGGVSKTTTCFNLGWMLAEKGKRVLLVDCDPQCNLTGMTLGFRGESELQYVYDSSGIRNICEGAVANLRKIMGRGKISEKKNRLRHRKCPIACSRF